MSGSIDSTIDSKNVVPHSFPIAEHVVMAEPCIIPGVTPHATVRDLNHSLSAPHRLTHGVHHPVGIELAPHSGCLQTLGRARYKATRTPLRGGTECRSPL